MATKDVIVRKDGRYWDSRCIVHQNKKLSEYLKDTGWKNLTLATGVKEGTLCGTPQYRKIGNHVFIRGSISFTLSDSTFIFATLPETYRPKNIIYRMCSTGGNRIARLGVRADGSMFIDWIFNLNGTTKFTGSITWLDINIDFFID